MKCELYNDNFQNFKRYGIPKAQLVMTDIPYNIGIEAYASRPEWFIDRDIEKGRSEKAESAFFGTDFNFNIAEFMHFCSRLLIKEPKEKGKSPCMIVFCAFDQIDVLVEYGKRYGFKNNIPLFFIKNYSPQVLKTNIRIVGAMEYAVILYRDRLPKFNNNHRMVFNWQYWQKDESCIPRIHPNQKPLNILKPLIELFTDKGDVVIDPCAGSGATLRAAKELGRNAYGFECSKEFYKQAVSRMLFQVDEQQLNEQFELLWS